MHATGSSYRVSVTERSAEKFSRITGDGKNYVRDQLTRSKEDRVGKKQD